MEDVTRKEVSPGERHVVQREKRPLITTLERPGFQVFEKFPEDPLCLPDQHGIGMGGCLIRKSGWVRAAQNHLYAALPECIGKIICPRRLVGEDADSGDIGVQLFLSEALHVGVDEADFPLRPERGGKAGHMFEHGRNQGHASDLLPSVSQGWKDVRNLHKRLSSGITGNYQSISSSTSRQETKA